MKDKDILISKLNTLPQSLDQDLEDYLVFLISQEGEKSNENVSAVQINDNSIDYFPENVVADFKEPKKKREFGALKGFVIYMADDFDAPMDEFKDYM